MLLLFKSRLQPYPMHLNLSFSVEQEPAVNGSLNYRKLMSPICTFFLGDLLLELFEIEEVDSGAITSHIQVTFHPPLLLKPHLTQIISTKVSEQQTAAWF